MLSEPAPGSPAIADGRGNDDAEFWRTELKRKRAQDSEILDDKTKGNACRNV